MGFMIYLKKGQEEEANNASSTIKPAGFIWRSGKIIPKVLRLYSKEEANNVSSFYLNKILQIWGFKLYDSLEFMTQKILMKLT